jgi:hypothetical protein
MSSLVAVAIPGCPRADADGAGIGGGGGSGGRTRTCDTRIMIPLL